MIIYVYMLGLSWKKNIFLTHKNTLQNSKSIAASFGVEGGAPAVPNVTSSREDNTGQFTTYMKKWKCMNINEYIYM